MTILGRRLPRLGLRRAARWTARHAPWAVLRRQRLRALPGREAAFRTAAETAPPSLRTDGPLVSIVVVGHGSEPIPVELREALARTTYKPLEILPAGADVDDRAAAIQTAIGAAAGTLILLLDQRALPVRPDWLGHLVDALSTGAVAAGPVLVLGAGRGLVRSTQRTPDLGVLSRGIDFGREHGLLRPTPLGRGDRVATDAGMDRREEVPALSLKCLLVRRSDLLTSGGYPAGYVTDDEEADPAPRAYAAADLACRLRADGRSMICDHRSLVLVRSEPATGGSPADGLELDRQTFLDRFGPRIARQVLADIVTGAHRWSRRPLRLTIVGSSGRPGASAPAGLDWRVERAAGRDRPWAGPDGMETDVLLVADTDLDIQAAPGAMVRARWVVDQPPADIDDYDLVLAGSAAAAELAAGGSVAVPIVVPADGDPIDSLPAALLRWNEARRFAIRIGASNRPNAPLWGDYDFARSLQRSLARAGHPTTVRILPDWGSEAAAADDATIHLFGRRPARNRPSQVNALWQISHPDEATPELYDSYDLAFVASDRFARQMAPKTRTAVTTLDQATDPGRFHPDPSAPTSELLYVANYREDRPALDWLLPTDHDLAVYGRGWVDHGVDPRYLLGDHIANDELHRFYGSAAIVLNDTWADMRAAGFVPNRIFDVLASGGFVISDDVAGIDALFDGAVPVYHDATELRDLVASYLADAPARREAAARGREIVLAAHTFDRRVETILSIVRPALDRRPDRIVDRAGQRHEGADG